MKTNQQLNDEIIELRNQLLDYHQRLEQALEHNTEFQINATWGIVHSVAVNGTWLGTLYGLDKLWHWAAQEPAPWWAFIIFAPLSMAAAGFAAHWSGKAHEADQKKLYRFPTWKFRPYE